MSRWLWSSIISSNHPGTIEGDGAAILDGDSNRFILAIHCRGFFTSVYLVPESLRRENIGHAVESWMSNVL
ncbi:hypothetical protein [Desulfosediminicola ganghwensis]|uniref:hypothetical protein n=1 Tax=Desulfosediminicola ganghwensis TaxID=2569540 RepID=UPI001594AD45|nr:hypothetical protein [Desulfosediminicola ganghwensis]